MATRRPPIVVAKGAALSVALGWFSACAPGLSPSEASDLRRRLDEAQRTSQAALKKTEELEDRVFLLTDQLESQKIASSRRGAPPIPAALPVVTLRPQIAADEHADDPSSEGSDEIEFRGSANSARPNLVRGARPLLQGEGNGGGNSLGAAASPAASSKRARSSAPPVEVPNNHDSLGVAAAPPIAAARRDQPSAPIAAAAPSSPAPAPSGASDDAPRLYRLATSALRGGQHDEAERLFRELIRRFPHHDYADNAQYWLGETFYDRKRFAEAASEFQMVLANYPSGNKAPDAMLKLALCLVAMGDGDRGHKMLRSLPTTYPRTDAARIAEEKLAESGRGKETR